MNEAVAVVGLIIALVGVAVPTFVYRRRHQESANRADLRRRGRMSAAAMSDSGRLYVRPECSEQDPSHRETRHPLFTTVGDLFDAVTIFVERESDSRCLLLLGDSGTGKSSFMVNYYEHHAKQGHPYNIAIISLNQPDGDAQITKLPEKRNTVLFLDGFDEDLEARKDFHARFHRLMASCAAFRHVVIASRSQFFPSDKAIPDSAGIARVGPVGAGEPSGRECWKLYIVPFDGPRVEEFLNRKYPIWNVAKRRAANRTVERMPELATRPMLLAHLSDFLESSRDAKSLYQMYDITIEAWLHRENYWAPKDDLRVLSRELAKKLYVGSAEGRAEWVPRKELVAMAEEWGLALTEWQITDRSLLNRDAHGNYKFAHRSMMEFLFVASLIEGDEGCCNIELTDQMNGFLFDVLLHERAVSPNVFGLLQRLPLSVPSTRSGVLRPFRNIASVHRIVERLGVGFEHLRGVFEELRGLLPEEAGRRMVLSHVLVGRSETVFEIVPMVEGRISRGDKRSWKIDEELFRLVTLLLDTALKTQADLPLFLANLGTLPGDHETERAVALVETASALLSEASSNLDELPERLRLTRRQLIAEEKIRQLCGADGDCVVSELERRDSFAILATSSDSGGPALELVIDWEVIPGANPARRRRKLGDNWR